METIPGSNVGKSVIQQVISALEDWRVNNHHFYKHVPEAQIRLRDDNRIRTLESAARMSTWLCGTSTSTGVHGGDGIVMGSGRRTAAAKR
jgi:hypothetical protein